jgi:hypothetical protein
MDRHLRLPEESSMNRARCAAFALFLTAALIGGDDAAARTERLRWTQSGATPNGFRVYVGTASRAYTSQIDVGVPPTDAEGAYFYDLAVPDTQSVYVSVTAMAGGVESLFSNERLRSAPSTGGGGGSTPPPPPPPPPSGAQGAVTGFALWNATTDTLIDGSFVSGETITLPGQSCVAIQILTNAYLDTLDQPGSVKKSFDGQNSACTTGGVTHENNAPYAWETDMGPGAFECAPTLTQVGTHTLTITPFDGNDCTGAQGTPVTLSFEVVNPTSTPPPPPPPPPPSLGRPGQPQLEF